MFTSLDFLGSNSVIHLVFFMFQGIHHPQGHRMYRYDEELVVPIIENTNFESDLKDTMLAAMRKYPNTNAVIVRRHGIYAGATAGSSARPCK